MYVCSLPDIEELLHCEDDGLCLEEVENGVGIQTESGTWLITEKHGSIELYFEDRMAFSGNAYLGTCSWGNPNDEETEEMTAVESGW